MRSTGPLPTDATVGDLGRALNAQTANLTTANGKAADLVAMIDSCNARMDETAAALKPAKHWWQF